jgi:hypothetical protein
MNNQEVVKKLEEIKELHRLLLNGFEEDKDYGKVNGIKKPVFLKPGAEKILLIFGLNAKYEYIEVIRDFDNQLVFYEIKCILYKDAVLVSEGFGSANTKEYKYHKSDFFTNVNIVLKMAKKRALVDAALGVAGLSELFTQDVEDMDIKENDENSDEIQDKPSENQIKFIEKLKKQLSMDEFNKIISKYNTKTISKKDATAIINELLSATRGGE